MLLKVIYLINKKNMIAEIPKEFYSVECTTWNRNNLLSNYRLSLKNIFFLFSSFFN